MISRRGLFGLAAVAALLWGMPGASAANIEKNAETFVKAMAEDAIMELTGENVDQAERRARFKKGLNKYFAVKRIGKWVLGRHWKRATKKQRIEYLDLFEKLLVTRYADQFAQYAGDSLAIKQTEVRSERDIIVYSSLVRPGIEKPVGVAWRLGVITEERFKVIDVFVAGLSLSVSQKKEFASVIRQSDNKVEGLLERMREMVGEIKG